MTVSLFLHGIDPSGQTRLREIFNTHARRIRRRMEGYTPDFARLQGRIEKHADPQRAYRVSLSLKLPTGMLAADREGSDLKALLSAFDELEKRLHRHLARKQAADAGCPVTSPNDSLRSTNWFLRRPRHGRPRIKRDPCASASPETSAEDEDQKAT